MVSQKEVIKAQLEARKALAADAAIKARIQTGQSWEGADKATSAMRDDASRIAQGLEVKRRQEVAPILRAAKENVKANGDQLARNCEREASLLTQIGLALIDVGERAEYVE